MSKLGNFMKKNAILISGLSVILLIGGCGGSNAPLPSGAFSTNNIYAFMKAVQDETGNVTTTVQLRDGAASTSNYLYLSGGETLYTSLDKPPRQYMSFSGNLFGNGAQLSQSVKTMPSRDLFTDYFLFTQIVYGKPEYYSDFSPGTGTSPVVVYVDFERNGYVMTGDSSIALPAAFTISAPVANSSLSRAAPITLTWAAADPTTTMELDVAGSCTDGTRYTLPTFTLGADTGSATLNSANYFPTTGISTSLTCRVALILKRVQLGGVSSQFAFGSFKGVQKRTVQFTTTP